MSLNMINLNIYLMVLLFVLVFSVVLISGSSIDNFDDTDSSSE